MSPVHSLHTFVRAHDTLDGVVIWLALVALAVVAEVAGLGLASLLR